MSAWIPKVGQWFDAYEAGATRPHQCCPLKCSKVYKAADGIWHVETRDFHLPSNIWKFEHAEKPEGRR